MEKKEYEFEKMQRRNLVKSMLLKSRYGVLSLNEKELHQKVEQCMKTATSILNKIRKFEHEEKKRMQKTKEDQLSDKEV